MYWLRDILDVRRSDYRTRFMNCVGILYNFEWCDVWGFGEVDFEVEV